MPRLSGKNAVVTGASSGIGRAIALIFAEEEANVIVNYRASAAAAAAVAGEISSRGRRSLAVQADVSRHGDVERLVREARALFGKVDIWVNNAGADILTGAGAEFSEEQKLQRLLDVDLRGTMQCCREALAVMRDGGCILNVSWDLCMHGMEGRDPQMFGAVKAGVLGFSKSLARELAPAIRVNVLAPGWIRTAFAETAMARDYHDARVQEIPMRRFGDPRDVAQAALFLASDEAAYITGQVLNINGGLV